MRIRGQEKTEVLFGSVTAEEGSFSGICSSSDGCAQFRAGSTDASETDAVFWEAERAGLFTIEEVATEGPATEIWHDIPVAEVLHHLGNIDQICASLNINQAAGRKIAARAEAYAKNLAAGLSGTSWIAPPGLQHARP